MSRTAVLAVLVLAACSSVPTSYRDTACGMSFAHPSGWSVRSNGACAVKVMSPTGEAAITIARHDGTLEDIADQWFKLDDSGQWVLIGRSASHPVMSGDAGSRRISFEIEAAIQGGGSMPGVLIEDGAGHTFVLETKSAQAADVFKGIADSFRATAATR